MKKVYLISYDIKNDRRLNRIHRFMKGKGIHLQKSVFYCYLNSEELKKLKQELLDLIEEKEDDVRIYQLLTEFETISIGQGERVPSGVLIYLD